MVRNTFTRYLLLPIIFLLFSLGVKSQTTYYVNDNSRTGDSYTSNVGNDANPGTAAAPFATISHAISIAVNGDIIYVDAGTFTGQLEINKQLSLLGHGTGITNINSPDVLALSYTIPPKATVHKPIVYVHDAAGVIIKNITVNGLGKGNANVRFQGIAYRNAGGTIQDCEIKGIRNTPIDGAQAGVAIYANANDGTARTLNLIHNLLIDYQKNATVLAGINLTINVNNNTVSGAGPLNFNVQNGFQVSDEAAGSITNNTISNISYTRDAVVAAGILVFGPGSIQTSGNMITNVQAGIYYSGAGGSITNNVISNTATGMGVTPYWYAVTVEKGHYTVTGNEINGGGNGAGIEADTYEGDTTTMTATNNSVANMDEGFVISKFGVGVVNTNINNNSITGSISKTIHNYGTATSNATCNWYGITDGVVVASKITGPVTFTAFSMNGTDNQPATSGFQPVPNACNACITLDVIAPTITLKSNPTVFLTAANTYTVQLSDVLQSVSDNCDPNPSATVSALQVSCTDPGSGSNSAPHQAYVSNTTAGNANYDGQFGLAFKVNSANGIVIDKLGAFDDQGNGITGSQSGGVRVAIFNVATQAIVPGLDVTISSSSDPLAGSYRMRSITPVTLPAGNYVLVTKGYVGEKFYNRQQTGALNAAGDNAGAALTFLNTVYFGNNPAFSFPAGSADAGNPNEYIAGTFNYALSAPSGNAVTVTATDVSGNISMATATVNVIDTFYVLTTKNATVNLNASGQATIAAADVLQSLKNNCGADVTSSTFQVSPSSFTCADIAGSSIPHQAYVSNTTAGNANYDGQFGLAFKVNSASGIVIDKLGAFDDQGNGITGNQSGGVRVAIFNVATQAIVPGLDVTISSSSDPLVGSYRMRSITPVTLPAGNYVIITKGYVGEKFYNRQQTGALNAAGDNAGGALTFLNTVYFGNNPAFSFPTGSGDAGNPNEYIAGTFNYTLSVSDSKTVTLTATDVYGHQKQATAQVIVKDTTGPTFTTKNITLNLNSSGNASIIASDVLQTPVTDNCAVQSVTVSPNSFTCADYSSGGSSGTAHQAYVSNTIAGNANFDGQFGLAFKVNDANGVVIDKLGAFDDQGNGISGNQSGGVRVAIFNVATQTMVPGLDVTISGTTDPLVGSYRMRSVTPFTLLAGNYVIVTKGYVGEKFYNRQQTGALNPAGDNAGGALSFLNTVYYGNAAAFGFPTGSADAGNPNEYVAGTFSYASGGSSSTPHQAYVFNTTAGNANYDGQFGLAFKVNSANGIIIDKLGAFDDQGNGITGNQGGGVRVVIFSQSTQVIVPGLDVTISGTTDPLVGSYRMRSITPVTLAPGNYLIITKGYVGEKFYNRNQAGPLNPTGDNAGGALTFLNTVYYSSAATFSFPNNAADAGNPNEYVAGTFNYALNSSNINVSNNKTVTVTATDTHGNVTTATATVTLTNTSGSCTAPASQLYVAQNQTNPVQNTDIVEVSDNPTQGFKVYPNPSSGQFTVQLYNLKASKVSLQIMDANGQVIEQKTTLLSGKTSSLSIPVDISKHASGIYLIKAISADGLQTAKVVVSR